MHQYLIPFLIGDEEHFLRQIFHYRIVSADHPSDICVYGVVFFLIHFFITPVSLPLLLHNASPLPLGIF